MRYLLVSAAAALALSGPAWAGFTFSSIDGGTIDLDDWKGKPVLVVNTASLCGFAGQFDDLQPLQRGLGHQKNACRPVWARPRISAWTSCVPS